MSRPLVNWVMSDSSAAQCYDAMGAGAFWTNLGQASSLRSSVTHGPGGAPWHARDRLSVTQTLSVPLRGWACDRTGQSQILAELVTPSGGPTCGLKAIYHNGTDLVRQATVPHQSLLNVHRRLHVTWSQVFKIVLRPVFNFQLRLNHWVMQLKGFECQGPEPASSPTEYASDRSTSERDCYWLATVTVRLLKSRNLEGLRCAALQTNSWTVRLDVVQQA